MRRLLLLVVFSFFSLISLQAQHHMKQFSSYYLDDPIVEGRIFDVFVPEKVTQDTVLFMVHGGGWRAGSRTKFHGLMQEFNRHGFIVVSTDYRLGARDAFEQLKDIREAYDAVVTLLKEWGRPLKIAVYGESAGAHLASLLVCAAPGEAGEDCQLENEWVKPVSGILQATPVDFYRYEEMMPAFWASMENIAGKPYSEDPDRYRRLSLCTYVREDNPPLFFLEAGLEHLFMSDKTLGVVRQHRNWGIPSHWLVYPMMEHGFFHALNRKLQRKALEDICQFLEGKMPLEELAEEK